MNTKLRTEAKNNFEKDFFNLMNNSVFGKESKKRRDIRLVTTCKKRNQLVSGPITIQYFSENLLASEMKKMKK